MSAFPPAFLGQVREAGRDPLKQPMKDVNPPPRLPEPKKRFAVLPHQNLVSDKS